MAALTVVYMLCQVQTEAKLSELVKSKYCWSGLEERQLECRNSLEYIKIESKGKNYWKPRCAENKKVMGKIMSNGSISMGPKGKLDHW